MMLNTNDSINALRHVLQFITGILKFQITKIPDLPTSTWSRFIYRSFSAEGFYRVYPSAEKPMNRTFAEKLKLLKEKQGILPCYAIRVEKHQKHPVVFEKAPVLF